MKAAVEASGETVELVFEATLENRGDAQIQSDSNRVEFD